jgi:flagellar operon protein
MSNVNGLGKIQSSVPPAASGNTERVGAGPQFEEALRSQLEKGNLASSAVTQPSSVRFSNHAVDRMRSRGISFSPQDMKQIDQALAKAQAKGSKDTLVLMDKAALILNAKSGTVVTVMDKDSLKENVFTNIDSTIVM